MADIIIDTPDRPIGRVTAQGGRVVVNRFEYQPGNGTRYVAWLTPLPFDADGGREGCYALVTLIHPWQAAYVFATDDMTLTDWYVAEKLGHGRDADNEDVQRIGELLRLILGRTA